MSWIDRKEPTVSENGNNSQEKLTFSDVWALLSELWLEVELWKDLKSWIKWTIEATRWEIDSLKNWTKWLSREQILERLNTFFSEKRNIQGNTREWLSSVLATASVWWAVWQAFAEIKDSLKQATSWESTQDKINWAWNVLEKIFDGSLFDKIWDAISWFLWTSFPWLADMLWLEKPATTQVVDAAKKWAEKAEQKVAKAVETSKEVLSSKYGLFTKVYFRLFKPSHEMPDSNTDEPFGLEIARAAFETPSFQWAGFNDLTKPELALSIYDSIKSWWKIDPLFKDKIDDKEETLRYIKYVLLAIHWGPVQYTSWKIFKETKDADIKRWRAFLNSTFHNIDKENPTMWVLFSRLSFFEDFSMFAWKWIDLDWLYKASSWKLSAMYQNWFSYINGMTEDEFSSFKDILPQDLSKFSTFKILTWSILFSSDSRRLSNGFVLDDSDIKDSISKWMETHPDLIRGFIWNWSEWLLKFWNDIYSSLFQTWSLLSSTTKVSKEQITLSDIYSIYSITWWKTDISSLTPVQKLNLTTRLFFFSNASDIWASVTSLVSSVMTWDIKIDPAVSNIIQAMWSSMVDLWVDTAWVLWKFGLWAFKENPIIALWIIASIAKFPFFNTKHSLLAKVGL